MWLKLGLPRLNGARTPGLARRRGAYTLSARPPWRGAGHPRGVPICVKHLVLIILACPGGLWQQIAFPSADVVLEGTYACGLVSFSWEFLGPRASHVEYEEMLQVARRKVAKCYGFLSYTAEIIKRFAEPVLVDRVDDALWDRLVADPRADAERTELAAAVADAIAHHRPLPRESSGHWGRRVNCACDASDGKFVTTRARYFVRVGAALGAARRHQARAKACPAPGLGLGRLWP